MHGAGSGSWFPPAPGPDPRSELHEPSTPVHASPTQGEPRFHLRFDRGEGVLTLAHPLAAGPLRLTELSLTVGRLSAPVSLSGGAARFRHRRSRLLSARLTLAASDAEALGWPLPRALPTVEGADLLLPSGEPAATALARWWAPLESTGGRVRVHRPMHAALAELLLPHGWRVPDERAARLTVGRDDGLFWLAAEAEASA